MTIQRMIELLEIEHECMLRGSHDDCDRNCADCELVQDDGELHEMYTNVIGMLKEQEEQKRKWLQTIADTQLAISPTGYENEDELAKRTGEWNGLQMAWEIIAGEERSERPMLVRCKDCKNLGYTNSHWFCKWLNRCVDEDWFCADGERRETE